MSLQVWLPLNGSFRNQGESLASFTATDVTIVNNDGKMGGCAVSTGSGCLVSDTKINLGKNQSVFCWIKPGSFNSSGNLTGVCGQHRYPSCTGLGITLKYASATTGYLCIAWGDGNSRQYAHQPGDILLTAGNWYHVGYTYDGVTVRLYVNGILDKSYNISNIATPTDYFHCFRWSLAADANSMYNGYNLSGRLNDVRAYNHTLSTKEIRELAKGKMIHYTFNEGAYDGVKNILTPTIAGASAANAGWDASLHAKAITVDKWTTGYNSGVPSPTIGYHAHWELIDGIPTMVFPRMNYSVSGIAADRWEGISESYNNHSVAGEITASTTYTISFEAMADTPGRQLYGGYYYSINGTSRGFHDGSWYANNIPVGKWKKYAFTFTSSASLSTALSGYFYFYGHGGGNGIAYLRNPQVEIGSTAHDFAVGTRPKDTVVYDASGMNHNGVITGTLISDPAFATGSSAHDVTYTEKNYFSAKFNGSTYVTYDTQLAIPDSYTMAFWIKKSGSGHAIDWRSLSGEVGIQPMYFNADKFQYYSSAGGSVYFDYSFLDNTWYHVALAVTSSTVTLYVNGVAQQTISATNPTGTVAALHLGCRVSYANIMNMNLKDFRLYSTTLSANDIKQLYTTPFMVDNKQNLFANSFKEGDS